MNKVNSFLLTLVLLIVTLGCTQHHTRGVGIGATIGGITGAILDRKNPWRGGAIGASLGAAAGAALTEISINASTQAAYYGKPVQYTSTNGRVRYLVEPINFNKKTKCNKVRERVWEYGMLIKDSVREVCKGSKTERRY